MVSLAPQANRSPHSWFGPSLAGDFSIQFALHSGMGPGGLLWRWDDHDKWTTLTGASAWGAERLIWPKAWHDPRQPFRGHDLSITWYNQTFLLTDYLD